MACADHVGLRRSLCHAPMTSAWTGRLAPIAYTGSGDAYWRRSRRMAPATSAGTNYLCWRRSHLMAPKSAQINSAPLRSYRRQMLRNRAAQNTNYLFKVFQRLVLWLPWADVHYIWILESTSVYQRRVFCLSWDLHALYGMLCWRHDRHRDVRRRFSTVLSCEFPKLMCAEIET